jgi:hypothetical protein
MWLVSHPLAWHYQAQAEAWFVWDVFLAQKQNVKTNREK